MSKKILRFDCVDCDKEADLKCPVCRGPWCKECAASLKSRLEQIPCHTCRNNGRWQ